MNSKTTQIRDMDTLLLQQEFAGIHQQGDPLGNDALYLSRIVSERKKRGETQEDIDKQLKQINQLKVMKPIAKKY